MLFPNVKLGICNIGEPADLMGDLELGDARQWVAIADFNVGSCYDSLDVSGYPVFSCK